MTDFELEVVAIMTGVAGIVYAIGTMICLCGGHGPGGSLGLRIAGWAMAIPLMLILLSMAAGGAVLVFYLLIGGLA